MEGVLRVRKLLRMLGRCRPFVWLRCGGGASLAPQVSIDCDGSVHTTLTAQPFKLDVETDKPEFL